MHSNGNWSPRVFLTRKSLGTPKKKKKKKKIDNKFDTYWCDKLLVVSKKVMIVISLDKKP